MSPDAHQLPERTAQVVHALMEAWTAAEGSVPVTAAEVMVYDSEALTVQSTAAALTSARRLGLADGMDGLWFATNRAWEMRRELEDRVCGT